MARDDIIDRYIQRNGNNNENANESFSISGLQSSIAGRIMRRDYLDASPIKDLHEERSVHIHDLSAGKFMPYCSGHDIMGLLMRGLYNPGAISSMPAKHFDSACDQIMNAFYISQNEFSGAQAMSNFDTALSPFVAADGLRFEQVKQILQRLIFNLNFPLRSNFQSPFTNLSFDVVCPEYMSTEPVVIGGEPQTDTFADFADERELINLAFISAMSDGANNVPLTFPIPTYNITTDFDWDSTVANALFELTAKFGLPYFASYIGSGLDSSATRSMCCRLKIDLADIDSVIETGRRGLWNCGASTGSIAVATINMPRIGYMANQADDPLHFFYDRLNYLIDRIIPHHEWKREMTEQALSIGLLPYTKTMIKNFDTYFSTIGVVGMSECCENMFGKPIQDCVLFVESVLEHMRARCKQAITDTGHLYNLEETPAEGLSHSIAQYDREHYPLGTVRGSGNSCYYTNSSHIYVGDDVGLIDSIGIQERFKKLYTGGTLFHTFAGESQPSPGGVKELIKNMCERTSLPYIAYTKAYAICEQCGMTDDLSGICPTCEQPTTVYDRVTGYYRPVKKFNVGKQSEFKERKRFF